MEIYERLAACTGFQWDEGNLIKIWDKHRVTPAECEQVFFNRPLVAVPDDAHSEDEFRFYSLGHTDSGRKLFAAFTIRDGLVRVISARDMTRRERQRYNLYG